MKARRCLVMMLCVALSMAAHCAPQVRPLYDRTYFEPSETVVTPHIAWAKPYYRGPIHALFITHRDAMREVVELSQRLSLDYRVLAMEARDRFAPAEGAAWWQMVQGSSYDETAERLRGYLSERWDVVVLGGIKWDALPLDCQYLLLKQVKEGTGLVGCVAKGEYKYLDYLLEGAKFHWNFYVWTGASQGIADYFGVGEFEGSVDYDKPHSGEACARIVGTKAEPGSRSSPYAAYHQKIYVRPNTEYVCSVWYRTTQFTEGYAWVSCLPVRGAARNLEATPEWTQASFQFNSGENSEITLYLFTKGLGTVWYDDVSLKAVGDERNLVLNPGFEQPGRGAEDLLRGCPWQALPAFSGNPNTRALAQKLLQVTRFGQGRIALLRGIAPPVHQIMTPAPGGEPGDNQEDYDYYLALAVRTIIWGARKDPEAVINLPDAQQCAFARSDLPAVLPVRISAARSLGACELKLRVDDDRGQTWHEASERVSVAAGVTEAKLPLPVLPHGTHLASLWLSSGGKTVDFASTVVTVSAASHLAEVKLDAPSFARADPVTGTVSIVGPAPGLQLVLQVRDNFGRLIAEQTVPATEAQISFRLQPSETPTIYNHLRAELRAGETVLSVLRVGYPVNDLRPDPQDIRHIMWQGLPHDFISPYIASEFYRGGVDTQYTSFSPIAPRQNLWHLPYATRFVDVKTDWYQPQVTRSKDDHVRDPCLTDPAYRQKVRETLTTVAQRAAHWSSFDYSLGDENHFVAGNYDLCFSDTCRADFRQWCREQYADIAALNAEWGTNYASFDEVEPITIDEARQTGRWAQWVDHRLHMDSVWAGIHDFSRAVIREVVPEARVGYEGSDVFVRTFQANDYWKLARAMNLNNIYYRDFVATAWHDFAEPGTLLGGGWLGGYPDNRNEAFMRWFPWRTLLKGSNSLWVWMGHTGAGGVMAPDLSLWPFFQCACEEINEFKRGIGKLLITAQRQHDGIALLYSPASVHVGTLTADFPALNDELNDAVKLVHDIGLECRVLSYAQVAEGALTNDEFRVLLLVGAQALSPAEVAAIRSFAAGGGTVIADLRPAVRDGHGKALAAGALDELFGVRQNPEQFAAVRGGLKTTAGAGIDLPGDLALPDLVCDGGLQLAGGSALGKVGEHPALVLSTAAGKAMLLNFGLAGYGKIVDPEGKEGDFAGWADGEAWRRLMTALLDWAGVQRSVITEPVLPHVEISRFRAGEIEYVGVLQGLPRPGVEYTNRLATLPGPRPLKLQFAAPAHVYDVRAGRYLGRRDQLSLDLRAGIAHLYALLPSEVREVELRAPDKAAPGETVRYAATIKLASGAPGRHVVRVTVAGPDGKERPWYARNLLADNGRVVGEFTFALDDQPGTWTITARDVASGVSAARVLRLTGR